MAEYGLAALVIGVGAKKLGLLALAFAFIAKFAKLGILAVVGLGAAFTKFFKRNKAPPEATMEAPPEAMKETPPEAPKEPPQA